jgi:hypothetical protein
MSDDAVVLRKYNSEMEARVAAAILEASGIPADVLADTAGGTLPSMALVYPVRLIVRSEDEELAREILETSAEPTLDDESGAT